MSETVEQVTNSDARELTAIHEPGHAAMALAVGLPVKRASILEDDDSLGRVEHWPKPSFHPDFEWDWKTRTRLEQEVMTLLAGGLAVKLLANVEADGVDHDNQAIADLLLHATGVIEETNAYSDWFYWRTVGKLTIPEALMLVEAIRDEFTAKTTISGKRLREIRREVLADYHTQVKNGKDLFERTRRLRERLSLDKQAHERRA